MKFTSPYSKPSLTPIGFKLLHISERKLSLLDGSEYDEGSALLKGLLVKQSIKSAWESVKQGSILEMNDWTSVSAMGLNVLSEEDEDELGQEAVQGVKEERWFEDLVSSFGEDDFNEPSQEYQQEDHEWVESNVSEPVFDEFDYDTNQIEAFTFPSPTSPTQSPTSKPATTIPIPQVVVTDVDIVEVDDNVDEEDEGLSFLPKENPSHHHHSYMRSTIEIIPSPSLLPVPSSTLTPPSPIEAILSEFDESIYLQAQYYTEFDDYIDDLSLPPLLIRSLSSSSTNSIESNEEDDECGTPPLRHSELDEQPSWIDQLKTVDDLVVAEDESDTDEDEDDIGIGRFTDEEGSGKLIGGVVGMALGFNEGNLVL